MVYPAGNCILPTNSITMPVFVFESDDPETIADKIWNFNIGQSCRVSGWLTEGNDEYGISRAELVLKILARLDVEKQQVPCNNRAKWRRKHIRPDNCIGGYLAHKIFQFSKVVQGNHVKAMIWRIQ